MKCLRDVYDTCNNMIKDGIDNKNNDVIEVLEVTSVMLENILWFTDNHENPIEDAEIYKRECSDVLRYIFDDLSYYMEDN